MDKPIISRLRDAFFRFGWLTPVILPLAQVGGRALVNVLGGLYLLWAIVAVSKADSRITRGALIAYLSIPLAFGVSLIGAHDLAGGFNAWFKVTTHISVFYFTLAALQQRSQGQSQLVHSWGVSAVALIVLLYLVLPWFMFVEQFDPAHQLKEDNLPFLLPFGLYLLGGISSTALRRTALFVFTAAVLIYIVLSEGRAALLGMGVALLVYGILVLRIRPAIAAGVALLVLGIGAMLAYDTFFRGMEEAGSTVSAIDRFTSDRTVLWRHALENPPASLMTGIGIGNLNRDNPVLHLPGGLVVGHLHDFMFDIWYETGFLGLAAVLVFLLYVFRQAVKAWRSFDLRAREQVGIMLSAILAILTAALLSFSYGSLQFDVYMFMLLAAVLHASLPPVPRPS